MPGAIAAFSTGSLSFDPTNGDDYVELPNTAALENVQENDFTFMGWYRPAVIPPNTMSGTTNDDGAQTIKEQPERILGVNQELEAMGVRVLNQWATLGVYDFVNVVEAPDNLTIARVSAELAARGTVRIMTLPAIPIEVATVSTETTAPPLFDTFGDLHRDIGTRVPEAQRYFDQGLRLAYGFNHEAAARAFAEAERLDPKCAMCAWGQALVLGPNINLPMAPELAADATMFATRAQSLAANAKPADRALIQALVKRYATPAPDDRRPLDEAYAQAMGEAASRLVREGAVELVVTPSLLAKAARDGLRVREYRLAPGERVSCTVTPEDDWLVSRLLGRFEGVSRVDLVAEQEDVPVRRIEDVPFEPEAGELVVAQAMPAMRTLRHARLRMRLLSQEKGGERLIGEYHFEHYPTL